MSENELSSLVVKEGKKGGAEDVAATCVTEDVKMIRFANNEITVSKAWLSSTINFMIVFKKRVAIASITDLSEGSIKKAVHSLLEIAKSTKPNREYERLPRGPFNYISNPTSESIQTSRLVEYTKDAINGALSIGAKRVAGTLLFNNINTKIETSTGASGYDIRSSLEISVRAFTNSEASGQANQCARRERDFFPSKAGQAAAEIAKEASNPVEGKPGKYNVILGPNVFANLINEVISATSAFNVDSGLSFLKGMLGKRVASSSLTLIDDGTITDGINSRAFDDEGVPTRRTEIIKDGILRSYLHNSSTAKKFKSSSTGNAGWIVPQPWNIIINKGHDDFQNLLSELDDGLYITNNWYTRFQDYRAGDFSTVCRDGLFKIKKGKIDQSIKGLRISDNMPRMLRNIHLLSSKQNWIKWWEVETPTLTPHALIKNVNLTKSLM
jgi:PmbA protein